jgi:nickel-dependent lactate racemase
MPTTVHLPYGRGLLPLMLQNGATVVHPTEVQPLTDPLGAVRASLRHPTAGAPLRDRVKAGQTVAIVVSDVTRPVPNEMLLPPVLEELHAAGIGDERITIVNGTGLHRVNNAAELNEMLGFAIAGRYRIVQHVARDRGTLVHVGRRGGVPVELCRAYVDADVRIVVGFVEPHLFAGFSGGAKGIMPGVAGADIVMHNHGARNLADVKARWLVGPGNPVFDQMRTIAAMCPATFLVNVTIDTERRLTGIFTGDLEPAHDVAIAQAARQYRAPIERLFDVVVTSHLGYPTDTTFYQSVKGMSVAAEGVREGGAIVLVAGCEEGIGSTDYVNGLKDAASPAALLEAICREDRTPRHDQWQIQCQAMSQAKADVYLHSQMSREDTATSHVTYIDDVSATVQELVTGARAKGREGSVLVLPYGQLTVPVLT